MTMDQKQIEELRQHYDNVDTSDGIKDAEIDDEIVQSPMVGITVRLPAEVLEQVRQMARDQGVKTTALIRRWIEDASQRASDTGQCGVHAQWFGTQNIFVDVPYEGVNTTWYRTASLHMKGIPLGAAERIPVA